MTAPAEEPDFVQITSEYEDGVWEVTATLGKTSIAIQTERSDVDSLPVLVNGLTSILATAWAPIEEQINQEAPND